MATFESHKRGNFILFVSFANFGGSGGESEIFRMFADLFADGINLIEGLLDGNGTDGFAGGPDGEKDGVQATVAHAWDVDVAIGVALTDIEFAVSTTMEEKWSFFALSETESAAMRKTPSERKVMRQRMRCIDPPETKREFSKNGVVGETEKLVILRFALGDRVVWRDGLARCGI